MTKELYQILEINETATAEEIKKAYRKLAMKWHPDKNNNSEESLRKIKEIIEAYEILGNEEKRRKYDLGQTNFTTTIDEELDEIRRQGAAEEEFLKEKISALKRKLKLIGEILLRSDAINEIKDELVRSKVYYTTNLDSSLWAPYDSYIEMIDGIEVGNNENDIDFIDRRKVNEFKEKMIRAIRERGPQLVAEKTTKANSDLERIRLKAIEGIEKELQNRGLKIEDLEEEYHNYEEEINGLTKKFKIHSYEDKVIEAIRHKSQSGSSGEFKLKKSGFSWEEPKQPDKGTKEPNYPLLNDEKKPYKELKLIADKKEPQKSNSKYDDWTKETLIKRIGELEAEIRELKSEKVEKDELPEFQIILNKKEKELKENRAQLLQITSSEEEKKLEPIRQKNESFPTGLLIGGIVIFITLGLLAIIISKSKKEK